MYGECTSGPAATGSGWLSPVRRRNSRRRAPAFAEASTASRRTGVALGGPPGGLRGRLGDVERGRAAAGRLIRSVRCREHRLAGILSGQHEERGGHVAFPRRIGRAVHLDALDDHRRGATAVQVQRRDRALTPHLVRELHQRVAEGPPGLAAVDRHDQELAVGGDAHAGSRLPLAEVPAPGRRDHMTALEQQRAASDGVHHVGPSERPGNRDRGPHDEVADPRRRGAAVPARDHHASVQRHRREAAGDLIHGVAPRDRALRLARPRRQRHRHQPSGARVGRRPLHGAPHGRKGGDLAPRRRAGVPVVDGEARGRRRERQRLRRQADGRVLLVLRDREVVACLDAGRSERAVARERVQRAAVLHAEVSVDRRDGAVGGGHLAGASPSREHAPCERRVDRDGRYGVDLQGADLNRTHGVPRPRERDARNHRLHGGGVPRRSVSGGCEERSA
jgi:hypothetical protein